MRNVAVVAPYFAPSSLPPAQRIRYLVAHLHEFGWCPTVIATDPSFYECPLDDENLRLLPAGLRVLRTRALPVRLARCLGFGDLAIRSWWHTWCALAQLCRTERVDLVFLSAPPYLTILLGRLIHVRFGIPYVIDYQDPWITDSYKQLQRRDRPGGWKWTVAQAVARVLEPVATRRASHLTAVSHGTVSGVLQRTGHLTKSDVTEIPLGFEETDFLHVLAHQRGNVFFQTGDDLIHLTYAGAFIPPMHDAARTVFAAFRLGLERNPALFQRVRLHFIGSTYAPLAAPTSAVLALAEAAGIAEYVDEFPTRVSYLDSLQLILDSDCLLLLGSDEPHYSPSKAYPYLSSGVPILALLHRESPVARFLRECNLARLVTFDRENPIAARKVDVLAKLEDIILVGRGAAPHPGTAGEFSARAVSRRLALLFDEICSREGTEARTLAAQVRPARVDRGSHG